MSTTTTTNPKPCLACKQQRRKCTEDCVLAPYFPPESHRKFAYVYKLFGVANVAKILNDLSPEQRDAAVKSMVYEAEVRHGDPVYGCAGIIYNLIFSLTQSQIELFRIRTELAAFTGPRAFLLGPEEFLNGPGLSENGPQHQQRMHPQLSIFDLGPTHDRTYQI